MKVFVGSFNEYDLVEGVDKVYVKRKKEETGLKYVLTKITGRGRKQRLNVWVCDAETYVKEEK